MNLKITPVKVALGFVLGICLLVFSGFLANIRWLFVAVWFIGLALMVSTMGYFVYHVLFYLLDKINKR